MVLSYCDIKRTEKRSMVSGTDLLTSQGWERVAMSYLEHRITSVSASLKRLKSATGRSDEKGVITQHMRHCTSAKRIT